MRLNKKVFTFVIIGFFLLTLFSPSSKSFAETHNNTKHLIKVTSIKEITSEENIPLEKMDECSRRLKMLEPMAPKDIKDQSFFEPIPTIIKPASEVIVNGKQIMYQILYEDPNWQISTYKPYWHSTQFGGRWASMPHRIHYAQHRLFSTYNAGCLCFNLYHHVGIAEEAINFKKMEGEPLETIIIIVMKANIKKMVTQGNQVVLIASPTRNGLQVLLLNKKDIIPYNAKEKILFQLTTHDGEEIDYSTLDYSYLKTP